MRCTAKLGKAQDRQRLPVREPPGRRRCKGTGKLVTGHSKATPDPQGRLDPVTAIMTRTNRVLARSFCRARLLPAKPDITKPDAPHGFDSIVRVFRQTRAACLFRRDHQAIIPLGVAAVYDAAPAPVSIRPGIFSTMVVVTSTTTRPARLALPSPISGDTATHGSGATIGFNHLARTGGRLSQQASPAAAPPVRTHPAGAMDRSAKLYLAYLRGRMANLQARAVPAAKGA